MARHTGTPMQAKTLGGGLFGNTLWRMAQRMTPDPVAAPEKKVDGRTARGQAVLPDDQVRAIRRAFEVEGKSMKQIASEFRLPYQRVYRLCTYQARWNVA